MFKEKSEERISQDFITSLEIIGVGINPSFSASLTKNTKKFAHEVEFQSSSIFDPEVSVGMYGSFY